MPDPVSVGSAEMMTPELTFVPSAGPASENGAGADASAFTVTFRERVSADGMLTPFFAITVFAPGEPNGVTVPSKEYAALYALVGSLDAPVPRIAGKSTEEMPDSPSAAAASSENAPSC